MKVHSCISNLLIMSDVYLEHISPFLENIALLQKLEMSAAVHCSKINSLIRSYKLLPDLISPNPPPNWKNTKKFASIMNSLNNSIEQLIQYSIQCNRDSCIQFVLMTSFQNTFEEFLSIRQKTIADLQNLNFPKAAEIFTLSPDELLSQDQVDLKLICNLLLQVRTQKDLNNRKDIKERISDRLDSLKRKDIKIETNQADFDLCSGIITIPSIPSTLNLVLDHEQLIYNEVIGEGRSGKVYKGHIVGRPEMVVAIKVLHCRELAPAELEMFRREIFTLTTLSHPSILKLLGYTNQPPFCLVTELLANGSIYSFLKSKPEELTPTDRTVIAIDVARGMEYMHERNIIHRDLKSLNILLDDNKRARICDFGLVRLKSYAPMTGLIGTPQWMAPEILTCSTSYNFKADVYSYGIVLWELLTGNPPYEGITVEKLPYMIVQENYRPAIPDDTPTELRDLIKSCWAGDPAKRPSFSMIIKSFQNPKNHFPGTDENEMRQRFGIFKKLLSAQSSFNRIEMSASSTSSAQMEQKEKPVIDHNSTDDEINDELMVLEKTASSSYLIRNKGIKSNSPLPYADSRHGDGINPNVHADPSLMSTPNMKYSFLNMHTHHLSSSSLPINHVDQIVLKYVQAIANNDIFNLELNLKEIMSLYKSGILLTIPNSFIPETVDILRNSYKNDNSPSKIHVSDEINVRILKVLSDLLGNRALFDQFVISDGFSMLSNLMQSSNPSVAELALATTAKHLRKDIITIDLIKALLVFNTYNDNKIRNFALTTLFLVLDFQFEMLCTMPSFIYHLLCFVLKPLPLQSIEQLLQVTAKFINKITSFPVSVMSQLIWLQTNVPRQFHSIAVNCLMSAVRLEEGRMCFPPEFWRYAQRDFASYKNLFKSYVHGVVGVVHKNCSCCFCSSEKVQHNNQSKEEKEDYNDYFKFKDKSNDFKLGEEEENNNNSDNDSDNDDDEDNQIYLNLNDNNGNNDGKVDNNLPLKANLPPRCNELVLSLKDLSVEHKEALQLLVQLTRDSRCARIVLTHLPMSCKISSSLLFKLYYNLAVIDEASLIIGEEDEFYTVCKSVLGSKYQNDACQLIRRVKLNTFLLENSGLVEQIISLLIIISSKTPNSNPTPKITPKSSYPQSKFKTFSKSKYKTKPASSKFKLSKLGDEDDDNNNSNFVSAGTVKVSRSVSKTLRIKNETGPSSKKKMSSANDDTNDETINNSPTNINDNCIDFESDFINPKPNTKAITDEDSDIEGFDVSNYTKEKEEEELWNLMSVIFTISQNRYFPCFKHINQNLLQLMNNSMSSKLRVGAFLCLANFSLYTDDKSNTLASNSAEAITNTFYANIDIPSVLNVAAELINNDNHAIQVVCLECARKNVEKISKKDLKQVISVFLQSFERQSKLKKNTNTDGNDDNDDGEDSNSSESLEFAEILFERSQRIYSPSVHDENNINYNKTEKHSYASDGIANGSSKANRMSKAKLLQSLATVCSQK